MAIEQSWRQFETLPAHSGQGWAVWRNGKVLPCDGLDAVVVLLRGWNPSHRVLVGEPGSMRFVPPVWVPQLRDVIMRRMRRVMSFAIAGYLLAGCASLVGVWAIKHTSYVDPWSIIAMLIALMLALDYVRSLRHVAGVGERALFFFWLQTARAPRNGFAFWLVVGLGMGGIQLLLQNELGGYDALIHAYGIMNASVREGEVWRLATGPFFHAGLIHFFNNFVLLAFLIGPIAWAILGPSSTAVFVLGNLVGPLVQMNLSSAGFDSYVGVSAGVFSLFGLLIVSGVVNRKLLPMGFCFIFLNIVLMGVIGSELLVPSSASLAHVGGLAVGAICAVAASWKRIFVRSPINSRGQSSGIRI